MFLLKLSNEASEKTWVVLNEEINTEMKCNYFKLAVIV